MGRWQALTGFAVAGVLALVGIWVIIYGREWERYVGVGLLAIAVALVSYDTRH